MMVYEFADRPADIRQFLEDAMAAGITQHLGGGRKSRRVNADGIWERCERYIFVKCLQPLTPEEVARIEQVLLAHVWPKELS